MVGRGRYVRTYDGADPADTTKISIFGGSLLAASAAAAAGDKDG